MRFSLLTAVLVSFSLSACERAGVAMPPVKAAEQHPAAAIARSEPETDKPTRLIWDDLKLPHDDRFEPGDLPKLAKKVQGRRINITGVMHGGIQSATANSAFVIMRYKPNRFGPGGPIDVLMTVTLATGRTVAYFDEPIQVEGVLRIDPVKGDDGSIWCVYHLDNARVHQSGKVIDEPAAKSKPER